MDTCREKFTADRSRWNSIEANEMVPFYANNDFEPPCSALKL